MSQSEDLIRKPSDREKALSAAFLRHVGATQSDAASATGIDRRTLQRWESCSWWPDVQREAAERWLAGLASKARVGLESAVVGDGRLALAVLERLEPALAPPRQRVGLSADLDMSHLTDEQLKRIARGEAPRHVLTLTG